MHRWADAPTHMVVVSLVRVAHVLAMALVVGGAALAWAAQARGADQARLVARAYEWTFWGAMAVFVATGIGNLGVYGEALPAPTTRWGGRLTLKLALVLTLIVFSGWRALLIARATGAPRALIVAYAATMLLSAVIVAVAVVLAHG